MGNFAVDAASLVLGDRNGSYGSPVSDYKKTAKVWSGLLANKLLPGVEITPKDAVLIMVGLKISREMHKHKPDNIIDAHGYLMLLEWLEYEDRPDPIDYKVLK